jgi:energy-coupling factor transporter ATP-binding protein EcfA2
MTNPYIALEGVFVLPDGRTLFSDLDEQFDQQPTGLVGRNGAGKTVLARILAGQLRRPRARVRLWQRVLPGPAGDARRGGLRGLSGRRAGCADALARIEAGSIATEDFDDWVTDGISVSGCGRNERNGLGHLDAATPARALVAAKRCASR